MYSSYTAAHTSNQAENDICLTLTHTHVLHAAQIPDMPGSATQATGSCNCHARAGLPLMVGGSLGLAALPSLPEEEYEDPEV